jgi:hypothetical protein
MKNQLYFISAMLFLCNMSTAQIPVEKESHHKVVLQNEYMRLLEGKVQYLDTTLAHVHSAESVVVFLSKSTFGIGVAGEKPAIADVNPGDLRYVAYGTKPVTHTVWNQSKPVFHFLVVEMKNKSAQSDTGSILSLPGMKLQIQQKLVRVYNIEIPKGKQISIPQSNHAHLLIGISGATLSASRGVRNFIDNGHFVYFPQDRDIDIKSGEQTAKCVLVEFK